MGLSSSQWSQVEALFAEIVDLSQESRSAELDRAAPDSMVRAELEALLTAADGGGDFLARPPRVVSAPPAQASILPGARLGPWRVLRLAGRGGMGEVYEAERADGQFEQRAAIKLLRHESEALLARFHAERQLLARLEHPGIARLLDGGVTPAGRPYAVMEYVEGETLTRWCRARASPLDERLRVFLQVCDAVGAAHRARIVHRDLKPANILVDAGGRVRLLDFGIARSLEDPPAAGTGPVEATRPETTANACTPEYAAPEQIAGEAITAATDVHALGLILFELLTGQRARLRRDGLASPAVGRLASEAAAESDGPPVASKLLSGDLDAIVAKCLRRNPADRFESVEALAADLERSRRHDPVEARGGGGLYRLGRWVRRHRAVTVVAGAALILLAGAVFRREETSGALYRTSNPEVFSQYQLGERFLARESQDGMRRAVEAFEKALRLEPTYAPALAGLALALTVRGRLGWRQDGWGDDGRRALDAAERAVVLAPRLAEAHAARGKTRSWILWDWTSALADLDRAQRLKPQDSMILQHYSVLLGSLGRLPEAIAAARRSTEADRVRSHPWQLLAFWYGFDGRFAEARAALERVLELNPDSEVAAITKAQLSLWEGQPQRALEEAASSPRPCLWCVAMARHSLGQAAESQRALDTLLAASPLVPYRIAAVYAWRGEHDRAFEWLDRTAAARHPDLIFVKQDRSFLPLHGDPRFQRLLATMNLPLD